MVQYMEHAYLSSKKCMMKLGMQEVIAGRKAPGNKAILYQRYERPDIFYYVPKHSYKLYKKSS